VFFDWISSCVNVGSVLAGIVENVTGILYQVTRCPRFLLSFDHSERLGVLAGLKSTFEEMLDKVERR
jgi:hypothetical protein